MPPSHRRYTARYQQLIRTVPMCGAERPRGPSELAAPIRNDNRLPRRPRAISDGIRLRFLFLPVDAGPVDLLDRLSDTVLLTIVVNRLAARFECSIVVDYDIAAD